MGVSQPLALAAAVLGFLVREAMRLLARLARLAQTMALPGQIAHLFKQTHQYRAVVEVAAALIFLQRQRQAVLRRLVLVREAVGEAVRLAAHTTLVALAARLATLLAAQQERLAAR